MWGGVTAYREELDAWVKARGATIHVVEDAAPAAAVDTRERHAPWPALRIVSSRVFLAALGLVVLVGAVVVLLWGFSPAAPISPTARSSTSAASRATPFATLPTTFRLRARMRGHDPVEFQATEGVPSVVEVVGAEPIFVEPQVRNGSLHVVLYERARNAQGAALSVTASATLTPARSSGAMPVRFLLDDGWLELAWLDEGRDDRR